MQLRVSGMSSLQKQKLQKESQADVSGDDFGTKLSINPNLPANTDFGGQNMDTPNSFKCNTPTTPFGLSHLQFPGHMSIQMPGFNPSLLQQNNSQAQQAAAAEELLQLMPKTPMGPPGSALNQQAFNNMKNLGYNFSMQQMLSQVQSQQVQMTQPKSVPKVEPSAQSQGFNPSPDAELDDRESESSGGKGKKLKRGRTGATSNKDESRWKSWTREEEVFLVGAVMDRFFKRGSLSSTRADDLTSDDSWSVIKNYYETAWKNYYLRTGISIPTERPANALSRHYKVMKARISQADICGEGGEDFRTYFDEWEHIYNVDNCLVAELLKGKAPRIPRPQKKVRMNVQGFQ